MALRSFVFGVLGFVGKCMRGMVDGVCVWSLGLDY